jgi:Flp pilus assembly protein TadG
MNLNRLTQLLADARGTAVIEMALVAPVLAVGVIGMVDISNAYSRKLGLEQGAQRAIEKIMNTTETATVEATLANEVQCQVNGSTTTTSTSNGTTTTTTTCNTSSTQTITVTWRLDCTTSAGVVTTQTTTNSATYDGWSCASGSTAARYVQVSVTDKYTPMFPLHFAGFTSSDGTYHISATAGVRTS